MTPELATLTWVLVFHAVCWIPYILNQILVRGLVEAVGYPENPKPLSAWAQRAKKAHYNNVENLVVFAAIVSILNTVGISNETTVLASTVYLWARVVHYIVFVAGIPWVRTLAFAVGWLSTVVLILQALQAMP
tara:strand:- start:559 stop:957 length:399 start_codon:yes stop_codon:yes gene_type:complete